jgi:hypothetical protein
MAQYPVKAGQQKEVDFGMVFDACFDSHKMEGDWYCGSFGSMTSIRAKYDGKALLAETESDKTILPLVAKGDRDAMKKAIDTQTRWNEFLESVTGFDAKERKKKSEEEAKKGAKAEATREEEAARKRLAEKLAAQRAEKGLPAKAAPTAAAAAKPAKSAKKAAKKQA